MERKYKNMGEVKRRISELLKEGYVFTDIYKEKLCFIEKYSYQGETHLPFITLSKGDSKGVYVESVEVFLDVNNYRFIKNHLPERYIFSILDFHEYVTIDTFRPVGRSYETIYITIENTCDRPLYVKMLEKHNKIPEDLLQSISFAQKLIEEYASYSFFEMCEQAIDEDREFLRTHYVCIIEKIKHDFIKEIGKKT